MDSDGLRESKKTRKRFFGRKENADKENTTEEEILTMVEEGHKRGDLQESEAEMISNIFELDEKDAKDIMTHRKNIVALEGHMTLQETVNYIAEYGFSRFPVYLDDIDNIIGVVHIKDLLTYCLHPERMNENLLRLNGIVRKISFIPETRGIDRLFRAMQAQKSHMVIVVDEYGQTAGLVTMEDIIEEIVGNILDEHDQEDNSIVRQTDGSFLMDGETDIEEVCEALKISEEDTEALMEDFDTLNGLIISLIDKIPSEDEVISTQAYGYRFDVLLVENKMVRTVRIRRIAPEGGAAKASALSD